jgi:hypothetical protein
MLKYLETIVRSLNHQGIDQDIENSLLGAPGESPFLFFILTRTHPTTQKVGTRATPDLPSAYPYYHFIIELLY